MARREKMNGYALPAAGPVARPARLKGGSRDALGEQLLAALCADFEMYGVDAIARVREDDPAVYLRVIAQAAPQTPTAQHTKLDELSDDELAAYLRIVREALQGRDDASGGDGAAGGDEPAEPLPPVSKAESVS